MTDSRVSTRASFTTARAGQKRPAEDEVEGEQRLTKKLGSLHIGQTRLSGLESPLTNNQCNAANTAAKSLQDGDGDVMHVDDTATRVFVRDLDREIAEIEAQELREKAKIEFLPEIEKKLNGVPKRALLDRDESTTADENNQLVLYRVPTALSIPQEQDSVRRAMVETRRRAREEKVDMANDTGTAPETASPTNLPWDTCFTDSQDNTVYDDAMDID